jgi:antitoxin MazE
MLVHFEKTDHGIILQLPDELAANPVFASGDMVNVARENGRLVVTRPDELTYDIEEMIASITDENRHAEISTGPPVGNEVW